MDKIKEVKKFYDNESSCYQSDRYDGKNCEQASYLIRKQIVLGFLQGAQGHILDAGCGPAIYTKELVSMGLEPVSLDLSFEMLLKARSNNHLLDIQMVNSEIEKLPFKDQVYDNVMSIGVMAYTVNISKAIGELSRVIKPGGILVIQCSNSIAPTPKIMGIKEKIYNLLNKNNVRWNFELKSFRYKKFAQFVTSNGFVINEKCSYDFRLPFIEKFFPNIAVKLMYIFQEKFGKSEIFGWFGEGYVIKAKKL